MFEREILHWKRNLSGMVPFSQSAKGRVDRYTVAIMVNNQFNYHLGVTNSEKTFGSLADFANDKYGFDIYKIIDSGIFPSLQHSSTDRLSAKVLIEIYLYISTYLLQNGMVTLTSRQDARKAAAAAADDNYDNDEEGITNSPSIGSALPVALGVLLASNTASAARAESRRLADERKRNEQTEQTEQRERNRRDREAGELRQWLKGKVAIREQARANGDTKWVANLSGEIAELESKLRALGH